MPLQKGKDKNGPYYQWGQHGKKYYFKPESSRSEAIAKGKAMRQARAIEWRKHAKK